MRWIDPPRRSELRPWLTNFGLILLGSGLLLLTRQLISEFDHFTIGFSGVSGWSAILYSVAVLIILTQPVNRYTFGIILTFAICFRLITLLPDPYLSSDIYRYAWDGVVQHAHHSPYRFVPADPALASLREAHRDLFDNINRRDYARTIYPPVAQFLFYLITFISPSMTFMKLAMILFEGLTMFALLKLLPELGCRREQSLLYAWCPLLIWEIGSSGHVDSAVIAFMSLALLARYRLRPILTGLFLGLAVMTKFYPIVLFPALLRRGDYKMPATFAAVIATGYACYSSVGLRVFGFLGGYVQEEGIDVGTRYFLLEMARKLPGSHGLSANLYVCFGILAFVALSVWCWQTCCRPGWHKGRDAQTRLLGLPSRANFLIPALALALALMLLFSPHYPWYIAWIVPFFALVPNLTCLAYINIMFYMCTTPLAVGTGRPQFQLNEIVYGTVLCAFLFDVALRRWTAHRVSRDLQVEVGSYK